MSNFTEIAHEYALAHAYKDSDPTGQRVVVALAAYKKACAEQEEARYIALNSRKAQPHDQAPSPQATPSLPVREPTSRTCLCPTQQHEAGEGTDTAHETDQAVVPRRVGTQVPPG